ncbi:MAG TPA: glycosyltransferase family 39 protein, partial [Aggregatilineales bacterium]|nr:glycosyltransferase family 39 protein [Aggregatilineales bacterium]
MAMLLLQLFLRTHENLALPGYADESHHLRRAEVAWDFNIDGYASYIPGKLLLYYYLGLFETQRENYLPVSRLAVALITLLGGAGIYAIGKELIDQRVGIMALFLYIVMPFTLFYDRMALADPLTLAVLMLATWSLLLWVKKPTIKRGAITGVLLILPPLAKLTALAVVAAPVLAVAVFDPSGWRK